MPTHDHHYHLNDHHYDTRVHDDYPYPHYHEWTHNLYFSTVIVHYQLDSGGAATAHPVQHPNHPAEHPAHTRTRIPR